MVYSIDHTIIHDTQCRYPFTVRNGERGTYTPREKIPLIQEIIGGRFRQSLTKIGNRRKIQVTVKV